MSTTTAIADGSNEEQNGTETVVTITAPNLQVAELNIIGNAPYVQERFSDKIRKQMLEKHAKGSQSKKGEKRKPRNFKEDYEGCFHRGPNDEYGIPASAFRAALISACRLCGFKMTLAKLSVFILPDFFDKRDGTPLVQLHGKPKRVDLPTRNATGVADIRIRPMWDEWSAKVKVRYDADQFSETDIANLFVRVGLQVGVGAGRPDSKKSAGMGWGTFDVVDGARAK
jgi:hypothetical protein